MPTVPVRKHVLLTAFPAFGHITPVLELGKKISKFHDVTFAIQAEKAQQLRTRGFVTEADQIRLFPIEDGYCEAVSIDTPEVLYAAVNKTVAEFASLLQSTSAGLQENIEGGIPPVDVVISDNFVLAALITPSLSAKGIPLYHFNTGGAKVAAMFLLVDENCPTIPSEGNYHLAPLRVNEPIQPVPESMHKFFEPVGKCIQQAKGMIANTVREMDEDIIDQLILPHPKMKGLTFHTVGPLNVVEGADVERQQQIIDWLDRKEDNSVVYVSFGSIATLEDAQLTEMAKALLSLNQPFIWSIPCRQHEKLPDDIRDEMSRQFESSDSRFLILAWAPQKVILGHPSTGVFVSHCGWNSTMECLSAGVPVVGWPMFGDQLMNATWLAEHGIGVMVEGTKIKSENTINSEKIVQVISEVGEWRNGNKIYHEAAKEWATKMREAGGPNGSSTKSLLELVEFF